MLLLLGTEIWKGTAESLHQHEFTIPALTSVTATSNFFFINGYFSNVKDASRLFGARVIFFISLSMEN